MSERILKRVREKVLARQYVMTRHARKEMNDEGFTILDVEHGLLTGQIRERQKDRVTAEWKYCITAETVGGECYRSYREVQSDGEVGHHYGLCTVR